MPKEQPGAFDRDNWEKQMENAPNLIKEADAKLEREEAADRQRASQPKAEQPVFKDPLKEQVIRTRVASETHAAILGQTKDQIEEVVESDKGIEYKMKNGDTGFMPAPEVATREKMIAEYHGLKEGASRVEIGRAIIEQNLRDIKDKETSDKIRFNLPENASNIVLSRARDIEKQVVKEVGRSRELGIDISDEDLEKRIQAGVSAILKKPKKEVDLPQVVPGSDGPTKEAKIVKPSIWERLFGKKQ